MQLELEEMGQWLKVLDTLEEDLGLNPASTRGLPNIWNASFRASKALF